MKKIEILLYPRQDYVNMTQNSNTSERGTHMNTEAIDATIAYFLDNTNYGRLYAPITCKVMSINKNSKSSEIIYFGCDENGNIEKKRAYYVENGVNKYVDKYMVMRCVHKYDTAMFSIGKIFTQQTWFYNQGRHSMSGADDPNMALHFHFEVAFFDNIEDMTTDVTMTDPRPNIQGQNLIGAVKPEKYLALLEGKYTIGTGSDGLDGLRGNTLPVVEQPYDIIEEPTMETFELTTYNLVTTHLMNVRKNPSTQSENIGNLKAGTTLEAKKITTSQIDGYYWVLVAHKDFSEGWVALVPNSSSLQIREEKPTITECVECAELEKKIVMQDEQILALNNQIHNLTSVNDSIAAQIKTLEANNKTLEASNRTLGSLNTDLTEQKNHLEKLNTQKDAKVKELELAYNDAMDAVAILKKRLDDLKALQQ